MRKHRWIELALVLVIIGVSFWNVKQQQQTVFPREAIVSLGEDKKALQVKVAELINEKDQLTKQVAASSKSLKEFQKQSTNLRVDSDTISEFINIVTKLFEANMNFTPENYEDRKQEISGYLSNELRQEYFGQNGETYQDANDSTSQLESLDIYSKELQTNEVEGLVVAFHKSHKSGNEWVNGMNIFKVAYNNETKEVTKIVNLGSGYSNHNSKNK